MAFEEKAIVSGSLKKANVIRYDTYQIAVQNGFKGTVQEWLDTVADRHVSVVEFDSLTDEQKGELKGDDGFSPLVSVADIDGGHRVSITDVNGTKTFDVMNGSGGGGGGGSGYVDLTEQTSAPANADIYKDTDSNIHVTNSLVAENGINANHKTITNVAVPTTISSAANKYYVDSKIKDALNNVPTPTANDQAANKAYVDAQAGGSSGGGWVRATDIYLEYYQTGSDMTSDYISDSTVYYNSAMRALMIFASFSQETYTDVDSHLRLSGDGLMGDLDGYPVVCGIGKTSADGDYTPYAVNFMGVSSYDFMASRVLSGETNFIIFF